MISQKEIAVRRHIDEALSAAMKEFKEMLADKGISISIDEAEYHYKSVNGNVSMSGKFAYTLNILGDENE